jgi:hypothetical protein
MSGLHYRDLMIESWRPCKLQGKRHLMACGVTGQPLHPFLKDDQPDLYVYVATEAAAPAPDDDLEYTTEEPDEEEEEEEEEACSAKRQRTAGQVALVVGVSKYVTRAPSTNCAPDVCAMSGALEALGYAVTTSMNASGAEITRLVERTVKEAAKNNVSRLLFYFSCQTGEDCVFGSDWGMVPLAVALRGARGTIGFIFDAYQGKAVSLHGSFCMYASHKGCYDCDLDGSRGCHLFTDTLVKHMRPGTDICQTMRRVANEMRERQRLIKHPPQIPWYAESLSGDEPVCL